jgi:hypothetical protein
MSTPEESAPLGTAPTDASPATDAAPAELPSSIASSGSADQSQANLHGPEGRIRVSDVMGLLGGRTDTGNRDAPLRPAEPDDVPDERVPDDDGSRLDGRSTTAAPTAGAATRTSGAMTTVFDCDVSRVLSHRKRLREENVELLTTSYVLTALAAALDATPEITSGAHPKFGVSLTTVDGEQRSAFLDTATVAWDISLDARVRAFDEALREHLDADTSAANLLVHHYGESGSLLATPTPIGAGHAASVGIGRVRREIVVRTVDGVEAPRVAARCYVTLSFLPERVSLEHANQAVAEAVRILESWDQ